MLRIAQIGLLIRTMTDLNPRIVHSRVFDRRYALIRTCATFGWLKLQIEVHEPLNLRIQGRRRLKLVHMLYLSKNWNP